MVFLTIRDVLLTFEYIVICRTLICNIISMKANKIAKRFEKDKWPSDNPAIYEAYGEDSSFICFINDDKAIEGFRAYSDKTGKFIVADISNGNLVSVIFDTEFAAESIIRGDFNSLVIYSDNPSEAIIAASILAQKMSLDYFVSFDGTEIPEELEDSFDEIVNDKEKGRILAEYLVSFDKNASLIITADKLSNPIVSLLDSEKISSIVILPASCERSEGSIPQLSICNIEASIQDEDNDKFKKLFLSTIDKFGVKPDDFIYAYLLNSINPTDTLDTVKNIAERIKWQISSLEEKTGSSILRNAICCSDGCYTGCVAQGGAAYKNSVDDCIGIIRYLVSLDLRYGGADRGDISRMGYDLYDLYKLGNIFRTMMEAGYYTTLEELQAFIGNFISNAQSNDHLTPIDDSHSASYFQRLDKIRCEQFEDMSPYLPDEVFLMRYTDGATLLIMAAKRLDKLPELFKLILKRSPNVDALDEDGSSALHYVGDLERWDALIAAGADTDIKDNEGRIPALGFDRNELEKLLDKKEYSETDIVYAERMLFAVLDDCYRAKDVYDNEDIIMSLLSIIRPSAKRNWDGYTPLMEMMVLEGYFPEIYDKMLEIGIDINAEDRNGNNTLRIAVLSPECTTAKIRYLIEHGADDTAHNHRGSVATIAAGLFHIESTEWNALWQLSDHSIFMYRDERADSPIMVALRYQNMDAARFLFSHDAVPSDEIEDIAYLISRIKSKAVRAEALEYFESYKARNSNKE